jgi:GTP-binding protein YchF
VGKSTLFSAVTKMKAEIANYPFCTIEPNIGIVAVPDKRLDVLNEMYEAKKVTPAIIEFVDIAGLVEGAAEGKGLGNKFLSHIREVDVIVHVVRCFYNNDIIHVSGGIGPANDIAVVETELMLSDLEILKRRIEKVEKSLKADKKYKKEAEVLEKIKEFIESGNVAREFIASEAEQEILNTIPLLSAKPVVYVANLLEEDFKTEINNNELFKEVCLIAKNENTVTIPISARLEEEISEFSESERKIFFADLNREESGIDVLIKISYSLLGLISFLTAGKQEVRAWTIKKGVTAKEAAGKIHTDMEKGFIKAEIVSYANLISCGGMGQAKEKGLIKLEGKDYIMQDGDVVLFRFNV